MAYTPTRPNQTGTFYLHDIDLREIVRFIDWRFYFPAWRLSGRYDGIEQVHHCPACHAEWLLRFDEKDRPKAEEALRLFRDTQAVLKEVADKRLLRLHAAYALLPARAEDDNVVIVYHGNEVVVPVLRQQTPSTDGFCYALSDFLAEEDDYVGVFANTVSGAEAMAEAFERDDDVYNAILIKTLSDRLAEATAEWLHWKVRKEFWGYAPEEDLSVEDMLKTRYRGIRPAVGYPSLPDMSVIFDLASVLDFGRIGISLTEHGAMYPNASVSGLYFAHPLSKYFMVGKISEEQLHDYALRRHRPVDETRKWLSANL